jgi:calcium/calmodulin-dependent protein kinase I
VCHSALVTYVLLCGYTPFWGGEQDNVSIMYDAIMKGQFEFDPTYWANISADGTVRFLSLN